MYSFLLIHFGGEFVILKKEQHAFKLRIHSEYIKRAWSIIIQCPSEVALAFGICSIKSADKSIL